MLFLLAITISAFSIPAEATTNFCDARLCSVGKVNIGCNNPGQMQCNGTTVTFNSSLIQVTLDEHNKLRQKIASGGQAGFSTATRMATMVWDAELASQALLNVNQCQMLHDQCRSTELFHYAGQNLAASWTSSSLITPLATTLPKSIQGWYSEVSGATASDIDSYPASPPNTIGHFTQVVQDKATHVGCAAAYYKDTNGFYATLLACNYAITNMLGSPVYIKGAKASKCTTGANPTFDALCSIKEIVNLPKRF